MQCGHHISFALSAVGMLITLLYLHACNMAWANIGLNPSTPKTNGLAQAEPALHDTIVVTVSTWCRHMCISL
jgi:dipeptide/tripeptide permease